MKETHDIQYWAVIPAAGVGSRMQLDFPKQYLTLGEKTLLEYAISPFLARKLFKKIMVVLHPDDRHWSSLKINNTLKIQTTQGADLRAQSVLNGLLALEEVANPHDWVLVHDAARPFLNDLLLDRLILEVSEHPVGGILALPVSDTLKRVDDQGNIEQTIPRAHLWAAQTPQMFRYGLLTEALRYALGNDIPITDESSAVEVMGLRPKVVMGDFSNRKITQAGDIQ